MAFSRDFSDVGISSSDTILNRWSQLDSHDGRTDWGICLARPKISNMFDFILTASQGEFLTTISLHTWGNGWANHLARQFAQLFPQVCGGLKLCKNTIGEATLGLYCLTEQINVPLASVVQSNDARWAREECKYKSVVRDARRASFFRSHRVVSLFFIFLFFAAIWSIFVKFKLHEICAMREAPGTNGLIQNLRWICWGGSFARQSS